MTPTPTPTSSMSGPSSPLAPAAVVDVAVNAVPAGNPGSAVMDLYGHPSLGFVRGRGSTLWTDDGTPYLDLAAGIAVCSLGHCHPHLVAALTGQARELWHVSNLYHIQGQERLAARLAEGSFADRVFVANSGTEAIETAIKLARRFHHVHGRPQRQEILTLQHGFHGRTLGALSAAGNQKHLEGCGPRADGFRTVDKGAGDGEDAKDFADIARHVGDTTAAVMVEPVQGEGGVRPVPTEWMREVRRLCDEHGLLLILDEVQTGFGRTGRRFAHEHAGITPDVMAVAKGMGGGFPVGACLSTEAAAVGMTQGAHGSTFGGNPLACAVANAVLDVLEAPGFLDGVIARGERFRRGLEAVVARHPGVLKEVRGLGLMLGLVTEGPAAAALRESLLAQRVLTVTAGPDVVRLLPPLIIDEVEIDRAVAAIDEAAAATAPAP